MIQSALARLLDGESLDAHRGAGGDGHDHGGRRDARPDRRLPDRAAAEGRDSRRDRRRRRGDAGPCDRGAADARAISSTRQAPAETAATRSTSRPPPLWSRRPPAPASRSTATAPSRRRRAAPTSSRSSASGSSSPPTRSRSRSTSSASASCSRRCTIRRCGTPAPVRRELAARTVFNVLGPLTNPAGARAQIVGVYSPALVPVIADVLAKLGAHRAFVVHGAGGIDELSPAGPNLVCEVVDGAVHRREIDPLDARHPPLRPRRAARRHAGRERRARSRRSSPAGSATAAGPPCS